MLTPGSQTNNGCLPSKNSAQHLVHLHTDAHIGLALHSTPHRFRPAAGQPHVSLGTGASMTVDAGGGNRFQDPLPIGITQQQTPPLPRRSLWRSPRVRLRAVREAARLRRNFNGTFAHVSACVQSSDNPNASAVTGRCERAWLSWHCSHNNDELDMSHRVRVTA